MPNRGMLGGLGEAMAGVGGLIGNIRQANAESEEKAYRRKREEEADARALEMAMKKYDYQMKKDAEDRELDYLKNDLVRNPEGKLSRSQEYLDRQNLDLREKEARIRKLDAEARGGGSGGLMKDLQMQKLIMDIKKAQEEQTPAGKLSKAPEGTKTSVGYITNAFTALKDYEDATDKGQKREFFTSDTPLIGSFIPNSDLDIATSQFKEAIGRLHSQGQIGTQESKDFIKMLPTHADSSNPAIVKQKLTTLRSMLENELRSRGFEPGQLGEMGYNADALGYGPRTEKNLSSPKGFINQAEAAPLPKKGTIEDGFEYLGGPPGDSKSWRKAQ